jgi:hypothetical protein
MPETRGPRGADVSDGATLRTQDPKAGGGRGAASDVVVKATATERVATGQLAGVQHGADTQFTLQELIVDSRHLGYYSY